MSARHSLLAVKRSWVPGPLWWLACRVRVPAWEDREDGKTSRFRLVQLACARPVRGLLTRLPTAAEIVS